jgi:hypothetical protein
VISGFDLTREGGESRRGFTVGGVKEEAAEDDAVLHIDPDKAAAAEVGTALPGYEDVAVIANLDGNVGAGEHFVEGVGEGHVASVMEHAVGDGGVEELVELVVAVEGSGGSTVKLGEEGKGWGRDGIFEEGFVVGRRRGDGNGRLLGLRGRWRCFLGGWRVGGGDGLGGGARQHSCGDENGWQEDSKWAEGRAKGVHESPQAAQLRLNQIVVRRIKRGW